MTKRLIVAGMMVILLAGFIRTDEATSTNNVSAGRSVPILAWFRGVGGTVPLMVISNDTELATFRETLPQEEVGMWPKGMKPPKSKDPLLTNAPPDFSKTMLIVLSAATFQSPEILGIYETKTNMVIDVDYSPEVQGAWAYWTTYAAVIVPASAKPVTLRPGALEKRERVEEILGTLTRKEPVTQPTNAPYFSPAAADSKR